MSKAAPIISNTLRHEFSTTKIDLPRDYQNYVEIFSYEGFGDLHKATFKFNNDMVLFKLEIDGFVVTEIDVDELNAFLGYKNANDTNYSGIIFNNSDKLLHVEFNYPIQFKSSVKAYAKANSNSGSRDSEGYSVFLTKDNQ